MKPNEPLLKDMSRDCHHRRTQAINYCNLSSRQCIYQSEWELPYVTKGSGEANGRMYGCRFRNHERRLN